MAKKNPTYVRVLQHDTTDEIRIGAELCIFGNLDKAEKDCKEMYEKRCAWCGGFDVACELYKIGCMSGKRYTHQEKMEAFYMLEMLKENTGSRFYLKESLINLLNINRADLRGHFVGKDFNIFGNTPKESDNG